jgi:hypothetical protein
MHWVIFSGLAGSYQYFVNHALPVLGEFRTLWRLDNTTFTYGKTDIKDELLPPLSEYLPENKVQDETWLVPNGTGYITKYDFTSWVRTQTYYGVVSYSLVIFHPILVCLGNLLYFRIGDSLRPLSRNAPSIFHSSRFRSHY